MLDAMVKDVESSSTLSDLKLVTACLLAFSSFLRASELVELTAPPTQRWSRSILQRARTTNCDRVMSF